MFFIYANDGYAKKEKIQTSEVVVLYEEPLRHIAREVAGIYPSVQERLYKSLHWKVDARPEIVLVKEGTNFRAMAGSDVIVAFAEPGRNLIVLDTSRVYSKPFSLESTLTHELCHLVLHDHIARGNLPRWLDEGVCQWASGGVAELMAGYDDRVLANAVMSDRVISLRELGTFPADERSLILAYEESKSMVEYIVSEYGKRRLLTLLENLSEGYPVSDAVLKSLSVTQTALESQWESHIRREHTWISYLSNNIYTILFAFAALITLYGFIRLVKKRREYKDEEEEKENGSL